MENNSKTRALATLVLLLLVVAIMAGSGLLQSEVASLLYKMTALESAHPLLANTVFTLLASLSILLGPFSSIPLVPFATSIWGSAQTLTLLMTGWLLGNALAYFLGQTLGAPLVKKILTAQTYLYWQKAITEELSMWLLWLFRVATPSETGYVFGLAQYPFGKYLLITVLAELPFALIMVYAGATFMEGGWIRLVLAGAVWIGLILMAGRSFHQHRKKQGKAKDL